MKIVSKAALALGAALSTPAQAIFLDNGIPQGAVGHFSADVGTGGAANTVLFTAGLHSGDVITQDLVFQYHVFMDPGADGAGFILAGSEPELSMGNRVRSTGTFIGANGNPVDWVATSLVIVRAPTLVTEYQFDGAPIGTLRILQYLDADVGGGDVLRIGVPGSPGDMRPETIDPVRLFGAVHEVVSPGNVRAGVAADIFNLIQPRIEGLGQPIGVPLVTPLPEFRAPNLGLVRGPADIVSVVGVDVLSGDTVTTARASARLSAVPVQPLTSPTPQLPPEQVPPVVITPGRVPCNNARCTVQIECPAESVGCENKATITVKRKLLGRARGIVLAAGAASTPAGAAGTIRLRTSRLGKAVVRANRGGRIRGVMTITNAVTGSVLSSTPIRIRVR